MLSKVETCSETLCRIRAGLPVRTTVMALLGVLGVEGSIVLANSKVCTRKSDYYTCTCDVFFNYLLQEARFIIRVATRKSIESILSRENLSQDQCRS